MKDSLDSLKARLTIPEIAASLYPEWRPLPSCKTPWRADAKPSFSVYAGGTRWRDHATGEGGDAIDFLGMALVLDEKEAIAHFRQMAGEPLADRQAPAPRRQAPASQTLDTPEKQAKRAEWPRLATTSEVTKSKIAELRKLPVESLRFASMDGALRCTEYEGRRVWVVVSADKRNAQARRLDGEPWEIGGQAVKARTLPGSCAAIPIGAHGHRKFRELPVLLTEGAPDLLAAYSALWQCGQLDEWTVACVLGASNRIPQECLGDFAGRHVRIVCHDDPAGAAAASRWGQQIVAAGGTVDLFDLAGSGAKDLNEVFHLEAEKLDAILVRLTSTEGVLK